MTAIIESIDAEALKLLTLEDNKTCDANNRSNIFKFDKQE